MEIKEYYLILKKNIWLILLVTAIFAAVSYFMMLSQKPTYQSSVAIAVDRIPSQRQSDVNYYQYDNFYSQAVSASLTSSLIDWLTSASTVAKVFESANYPLPNENVKALSKIFIVNKKQETSSVMNISYSSSDKIKAESIISATASALENEVSEYAKSDPAAKFIARSNDPVVIIAPKQLTINVLIATFLGFVISLGIISVREALK